MTASLTLIMLHFIGVAIASRVPLEVLELPQSTAPFKTSSDEFVSQQNPHYQKDQQKPRQVTAAAHSQDIKIFYQVGVRNFFLAPESSPLQQGCQSLIEIAIC